MTRQARVLFVCLGNICRSPTAQGVTEKVAAELELPIECDSAGTGAWHVGHPPDERAQVAARRRGVDLSRQRARQVRATDFELFDWILAMDAENLRDLQSQCPPAHRDKLRLFLSFAVQDFGSEVPDPYYGGEQGFETVLDLAEAAAHGLCRHLANNRN